MGFSRVLKSSPHCKPSPDGTLVATLFPAKISIRSLRSLGEVKIILLPAAAAGPVLFFLWSPSSSRILVAGADQIHVFSVLDSKFQAVIRNPAGTAARPTLVSFGSDDNEVCVWAGFGLKLAIFNLSTSKAVEINNPKFHHASSALSGCSFRPRTWHMALLTRAAGKDVVSIHAPGTRAVLRSWQPDTIDAQGLMWTIDGKWLLLWDSSAHGHKLLFYTPDGNLFRSWIGPRGAAVEDQEAELGAGIKLFQLSYDPNRAAVGDHSKRVFIIDPIAVTETMRLQHPLSVTPSETLQIWQEQIASLPSGAVEHSFVRASQTVYPPTRPSNNTTPEPKSGCAAAVFDSSSTLLAVKLEDSPSTIWIWDVLVAELRGVLIFHATVSSFSWHPYIRESLLVTCEEDDYRGLAFVWDPLSSGPQSLDFSEHLPDRKPVGKCETAWLRLGDTTATIFFSDAAHQLLGSQSDGDTQMPWEGDENTSGQSVVLDFESPLEIPAAELGRVGPALALDEDLSEMDDTFSFKRT